MGNSESKFAGEGQRLGSVSDSSQSQPYYESMYVPGQPRSQPPMQEPSILAPARMQNVNSPEGSDDGRSTRPVPARTKDGNHTGGGGGSPGRAVAEAAKRAAAAAAAERRVQDDSKRGTAATNANQGALSRELERQKREKGYTNGNALPERVVWD